MLVATAGPILYLLGSVLFERSVADRTPVRHLVAIAALAAAGAGIALLHASGVALGAAVLGVLLVLAASATPRRRPQTS